jgi:hypothetical protein
MRADAERYGLAVDDERDTEALRAEQLAREVDEKQRAEEAFEETEEAQHDRRAEKARYLGEKLEERAESEREAEKRD